MAKRGRPTTKAPTPIADLNFKVDASFHRAFKLAAALKGGTMRDLLEESFKDWALKQKDPEIKKLVRG